MLSPLAPGATIGVVAPAAPVHNRSDVLRGIAFWERHGFRVRLSDNLFDGPVISPAMRGRAHLLSKPCSAALKSTRSRLCGVVPAQL